jgi:hypothetical protein
MLLQKLASSIIVSTDFKEVSFDEFLFLNKNSATLKAIPRQIAIK